MKLSQLCTIKKNMPDADFWVRAIGMEMGKPYRDAFDEVDSYDIGIKVTKTKELLPDYLYYWFENAYNQNLIPEYTVKFLKNIEIAEAKK